MKEEYKVSIPLISNEELLEIDKNWQYLVDTYMMMTLKEKDQLIAQYVMKKQKEEIERLNNNWNELRKWVVNNKHNENTKERYLVVDYGTLLGKMSELKGVDKE